MGWPTGDLPLVLQVICEIDRRHATLTEFGLDAVAAFEGCVQAFDCFAHALKMRRRSAEREILQQHQRQPQREQPANDDHAHEAHRAEELLSGLPTVTHNEMKTTPEDGMAD